MADKDQMSQTLLASPDVDRLYADFDESEQRRILTRAAQRAGFELEHQGMSFAGYYPEIEKDLAETVSRLKCGSLLISGALGVGKTGLLCATFKAFAHSVAIEHQVLGNSVPIRIGTRCRVITHGEFNDLCKAEIKSDDLLATPDQIITDPLVLILDDLIDISRSEWLVDHLEKLINHRWQCHKATWITSNLSLGDMKHLPGYARIVSRLSDDSWMSRWVIPGKDKRPSKTS